MTHPGKIKPVMKLDRNVILMVIVCALLIAVLYRSGIVSQIGFAVRSVQLQNQPDIIKGGLQVPEEQLGSPDGIGIIIPEEIPEEIIKCHDLDEDGYSDTGAMVTERGKSCCYSGSRPCDSTEPDCDDTNPFINPDIREVCTNTWDDNCNGLTDCQELACCEDEVCRGFEGCTGLIGCLDNDADGYGVGDTSACPFSEHDCDDENQYIHPTAEEQCGNALDDDCDGLLDCDDDECALHENCQEELEFFLGSTCGDGILDGDEICDPGSVEKFDGCLPQETKIGGVCYDNSHWCGAAACAADCTCDGCYYWDCGDAILQMPPEECDLGKLCSDLVTDCTADPLICSGFPDPSCVVRDGIGCTAECLCEDLDGDGFFPLSICVPSGGAADCNDLDPNIKPGAIENCGDSIDNDCDGFTDDADPDCGSSGGDDDDDDTCEDECDAGDRRCSGSGVESCGDFDEDSCREWGITDSCLYGCYDGECIDEPCTDECIPGALRCISDSQFQICENDIIDGRCDGWSDAESCGALEFCDDGYCYPDDCTYQCSLGESVCVSQYDYHLCMPPSAPGECNEWGSSITCPSGDICEDGICIDSPTCTDQCDDGERRCQGSKAYQLCGQSTTPPFCNVWDSPQSCEDDEVCDRGSCITEQCSPECSEPRKWCISTWMAAECRVGSAGCFVQARTQCTFGEECVDGTCAPIEFTLAPGEARDQIRCNASETTVRYLNPNELPVRLLVPEGYIQVVPPFSVDCAFSNQVTFNVPGNLRDIRLLYCTGDSCTQASMQTTKYVDCPEYDEETIIVAGDLAASSKSLAISEIVARENLARVIRMVENREFDISESIMLSGTMIEVDVGESRGTTLLTVPYLGENVTKIAVYAKSVDPSLPKWSYQGGSLNREKHTITMTISDIEKYVSDGSIQLAVIPVGCVDCEGNVLHKVYEPTKPVRRALILVHGWGVSSRRFTQLIDEMRVTDQPWQIWTFDYPKDQNIDVTVTEFMNAVESASGEFDDVVIVAHSLGGIVAQQSVTSAYNAAKSQERVYGFLPKVRKMILVAVPNDGLIRSDMYQLLKAKSSQLPLVEDFFDIPYMILEELKDGRVTPRVPGIDYYVVAGTRDYFFTKSLGVNVKNDGLVSVRSAQHIGDDYVEDRCVNYYELDVSHTDLLDNVESVRIIARLAAKDLLETQNSALLGYNQIVNIDIPECDPSGYYWVVGKIVDADETDDPCNCGNKICGAGEDEMTCPEDCAAFHSNEEACFLLKGMKVSTWAMLAVLILIVLASIAVFRIDSKNALVLLTFMVFAAATAMTVIEFFNCVYPINMTNPFLKILQGLGLILEFVVAAGIFFLYRFQIMLKERHVFVKALGILSSSIVIVLLTFLFAPWNEWLAGFVIFYGLVLLHVCIFHHVKDLAPDEVSRRRIRDLHHIGERVHEIWKSAVRSFCSSDIMAVKDSFAAILTVHNSLKAMDDEAVKILSAVHKPLESIIAFAARAIEIRMMLAGVSGDKKKAIKEILDAYERLLDDPPSDALTIARYGRIDRLRAKEASAKVLLARARSLYASGDMDECEKLCGKLSSAVDEIVEESFLAIELFHDALIAQSIRAWSYHGIGALPERKRRMLHERAMHARDLLMRARRAYFKHDLLSAFDLYKQLEVMYDSLLYDDKKDVYGEMVFLYNDLDVARHQLTENFARKNEASSHHKQYLMHRWLRLASWRQKQGIVNSESVQQLMRVGDKIADIRSRPRQEAHDLYKEAIGLYSKLPDELKAICYRDLMRSYHMLSR